MKWGENWECLRRRWDGNIGMKVNPWNRVLLERKVVTDLVNKSSACMQPFSSVPCSQQVRHWSLTWAKQHETEGRPTNTSHDEAAWIILQKISLACQKNNSSSLKWLTKWIRMSRQTTMVCTEKQTKLKSNILRNVLLFYDKAGYIFLPLHCVV